MTKTRNRFLSLLLTFAMVVGMMTTAFAYGGQVNITFANGDKTTLTNTSDVVLHRSGVSNVESVVISTNEIASTPTPPAEDENKPPVENETKPPVEDENKTPDDDDESNVPGDENEDENLGGEGEGEDTNPAARAAVADFPITYRNFSATINGTMPNGTQYQIYTQKDDNGLTVLKFRYLNNLVDTINIKVNAKDAEYSVYAGSGVYGQNNNQGGLATCTTSRNSDVVVKGGASYSVTFTPVIGQEITKLNLRLDAANGVGNLFDITEKTVNVGGQELRIEANNDGSVTVTADSVIQNLYLVALTKDAAARYDLNTITDGNCTVDVSSTSLVSGATKVVTFKPTTGYTVTDITITDGTATKTLAVSEVEAKINGKTYTVDRKLDGSAVLSVPAMSDNVFISAVAANDVHYVKVNSGRNVRSSKPGVNYIKGSDTFEVVYAPTRSYTDIRSLTISTPSTGTRIYSLDGSVVADSTGFSGIYFDASTGKWYNGSYWETIGDNWIIGADGRYYNTETGKWYDYPYSTSFSSVWVRGVDGRYYNTETGKWYDAPYFSTYAYPTNWDSSWQYVDGNWIRDAYGNYVYRNGYNWGVNGATWTIGGATIRLYYDSYDYLHVLLQNVTENMEFTANSRDSIHTVSVTGDRGVSYDKKSYDVDDGDDLELEFAPAKDNYTIRYLYITYGSNTYKANVNEDDFIRVDGIRWNIDVDKDGVVTLDMADISEDVLVRAESNYTITRNMTITKNADTRSNISYTGTAPFDSEDKTTVRVYTNKDNYVLDEVTFKMGSKSVSVEPFDTKLEIGGMTYKIKWIDNTEFSVEFDPLPGSLVITSKTIKGDKKDAPAVPDDDDDKKKDDDNKNETPVVTPPDTQTPVMPAPSTNSVTHNAYMKGIGNGKFAPDKSLTRAEAVTLLNRAILGMDDSATTSYASSAYFTDVPASFWGAGAINYAGSQGYLSVLNTSSNFNPNNPITRAEFLALLCKYRNVDVSSAGTASAYSDVPSSHWAIQYINYATTQGWVQGVGNNQFTPDSAVTRAAICTMVNHILGRAADSSKTAATGATFSDVPLSYWGYADIFEATFTHQASVANGVETWM